MTVIAVAMPAAQRDMFFAPPLWQRLAELGTVTVVDPPAVVDADVLVTGWGCPPLSVDALAHAPALRLVAHAGASVRSLVTAATFARGIRVTQAGEAMAPAVAEQALAMTLTLLHRIHRFDHALHAGEPWSLAKDAPARRELRGCPVGVVGASRTGRAYIALVRALGAVVRVADPYLNPSEAVALSVEIADLHTLLRTSVVVSLHAPVLPETAGMIGAPELGLIPDGGLLVNTARAALVDEQALLAELSTGRLDAALDVFDLEPLPVDHPLRALPNVLLTPHEAAGTVQSRRRAGGIVLAEIGRFLAGEPLEHEITPALLARMG
jgi:phosphoglycerate dehydrogenase-like enzyme